MTENDLTQYLKTAFEYKNDGEYKKSIDYFYKALALDNESSEIMSELAYLYSKLCQYDRAISFYEQIMTKNPTNYIAKFQYALLLKSIKEYTKAEEIFSILYDIGYEVENVAEELFELCLINNDYEKIIKYFSKYPDKLNSSLIYYYVAQAHERIGRKELSEEFYSKAYNVDKNNALAGINVVNSMFEKGQMEEAEALALELLKYTEDAKILYLLAEIAYAKGNIDSSIKYYSYAVKVDSQNSLYYFKLAIAFSLKGFFKEAEECFCRAISLEPENQMYNYSLAYMYYMNKKMELAEQLADYILTLNPDNFQALSLKTLLLINKNEVAYAGKLIQEIEEKKEKDDFSFYAQALYYSKLNMWEKTIDNMKKAINFNGASIEYKYQLAKFYYNVLDFDSAKNILNEVVSKNSKYIQAYILFAEIYMKDLKYDLAKENINMALSLDKNLSDAYYILAEINFIYSEYESAINNYKIAASMNPNNEKYFSKIAECYYKLENYKDAYFYYKEASDFDITNADYRYYMAKCSIYNNDYENAIANFSVMKRLSPLNISYIEEYADYVATSGNKKRAINILESLMKNIQNPDEKEKLKKNIKNIKKRC